MPGLPVPLFLTAHCVPFICPLRFFSCVPGTPVPIFLTAHCVPFICPLRFFSCVPGTPVPYFYRSVPFISPHHCPSCLPRAWAVCPHISTVIDHWGWLSSAHIASVPAYCTAGPCQSQAFYSHRVSGLLVCSACLPALDVLCLPVCRSTTFLAFLPALEAALPIEVQLLSD